MNQRSSRSHFIVNFKVETRYLIDYEDNRVTEEDPKQKQYYEVKKKSEILFIDLAGSESQKNNNELILNEGCYINKSLSVLNQIIRSMSKKKNTFQHYRDSKLTFFLKEIFKGNSHFCILGNILPYQNYILESLNTLNFVSMA